MIKQNHAIIKEIILLEDGPAARLECPSDMIPAAGQYLLSSHASDSALAVPVFCSGLMPEGFLVSQAPSFWAPGMRINLRGPLGRGFAVPMSARRVALIANPGLSARKLFPLIDIALRQDASITLVADLVPDDLSSQVEVQPNSRWLDVLAWADYSALYVERASLPGVMETLGPRIQNIVRGDAQILIDAPVVCGGVADCGVCAIRVDSDWKMVCKDGPVFNLFDL